MAKKTTRKKMAPRKRRPKVDSTDGVRVGEEPVPEQPDWEALEEVKRKSEQFALRDDVFHFFAPEGFHKSKIGPWLKRSFHSVDGTGRTWSTVVKVMAKAMG